MARQIVIQPNGLYAIWSTIVDDFIEINLSETEYIKFVLDEICQNKKDELLQLFESIKQKDFRYCKNYEECMESIESK